MKIASIILLYTILSLSKSDRTLENNLENKSLTVSDVKAIKRQLMFPKRNMKFIVNSYTQNNVNYYKERENNKPTITRKPLMVKFIPNTKMQSAKTTEQVTRKSLMKVRAYTVKMRPNLQSKDLADHQAYRMDKSKNEEELNIDVKARKPLTTNIESEELESSQTKIAEVIRQSQKDMNEPDIINKYWAEEEQDRNEFIFLQNKDMKTIPKDFIDVDEAEFETTTKSHMATNLRHKRKSNIIEEDNATIVSALKYTGRDSRLAQDLYYKNINH